MIAEEMRGGLAEPRFEAHFRRPGKPQAAAEERMTALDGPVAVARGQRPVVPVPRALERCAR
jgi:hypothetical protein